MDHQSFGPNWSSLDRLGSEHRGTWKAHGFQASSPASLYHWQAIRKATQVINGKILTLNQQLQEKYIRSHYKLVYKASKMQERNNDDAWIADIPDMTFILNFKLVTC